MSESTPERRGGPPVGDRYSLGMEQRHDEDTRGRVQITPEIIAEMRAEFDRMKEYEMIDALDRIREESGIGWAIYCSAFMGREVDGWRVEVCEALSG